MPVTNYLWDELSDNLLMETDASDTTTTVYTNEPAQYGALISQRRAAVSHYHHYDGEGNTRAVSNGNGDVLLTTTYSAFGEAVTKTNSITNPFAYKGALGYYTNEEAGDIYVRERAYNPTIGRWLSVDPLVFVDGPDNYVFVRNNPLTFVDPSGLACYVCKSGINQSGELLTQLDAEVDRQPYTDLAKALTDYTNRRYPIHQLLVSIQRMGKLPYPTHTGRFGIRNVFAPLDPPLPAGTYAVAAKLHFVWFDVSEDNPGDCLLRVVERVAQQEYNTNQQAWVDDRGFPRVLQQLFKAPNRYPPIGSTPDVIVKLVKQYDCCNFRIILGDMSSIDTMFREYRHQLIGVLPQMIRRILIEQWVWTLNDAPRQIVGDEYLRWAIGFTPSGQMIV